MTKKIQIVIAGIVAIPLIIFLWHQYKVDLVKQTETKYQLGMYTGTRKLDTFRQEENLLSTVWDLKDDKMLYDALENDITPGEYTSLGKNYLVRQNIKIKNEGLAALGYSRDTDEYWKLNIYDLNKMDKQPYTLDILKEIEGGGDIVSTIPGVILINRERQEVLPIILYTSKKEKYYKLLNLETKEIEEYIPKKENSDIIPGYEFYPSELYSLLYGTNLSEKFETLGLKISKSGRMLYPTSEKVSNKYFKSLFPDNNGKLTEDNQVFILVDTIPKLLTNYERFFESPKELYNDLVIEADHSTDGREHTVQSKEEFLQYYQAP
ncbi:hypothetical protein [Streptococcus pluranimalium]|uniref:Uncharacterized protein n=1 Tax=Streptococcus pluranimalium TaxID=82348 RepID=A0A345VJI9_9STRE|nr:hypothetical protein [Streptococcus pluranimalium]AXJ12891.1 hypothetical protein Sp14A_09700 [Streptococcus pluranimalium]